MNYLFRICLVGDSGTGKTTFIESLKKNFYYETKEKTIKWFSFGIVAYSIFYLAKATFLFSCKNSENNIG